MAISNSLSIKSFDFSWLSQNRFAKRFLVVLGAGLFVLVFLIASLYGTLRSNLFWQSYGLPYLNENLDVKLTSSEVDVDLLGRITLKGADYSLPGVLSAKAQKLAVEFETGALFGGEIIVSGVELIAPSIDMPGTGSKSSAVERAQDTETQPSQVDTPIPVFLQNLNIRQAELRYGGVAQQGKSEVRVQVKNLEASLDQYASSSTGKLSLAGQVYYQEGDNHFEIERVEILSELIVGPNLLPVQGKIDLNVASISGRINTFKMSNDSFRVRAVAKPQQASNFQPVELHLEHHHDRSPYRTDLKMKTQLSPETQATVLDDITFTLLQEQSVVSHLTTTGELRGADGVFADLLVRSSVLDVPLLQQWLSHFLVAEVEALSQSKTGAQDSSLKVESPLPSSAESSFKQFDIKVDFKFSNVVLPQEHSFEDLHGSLEMKDGIAKLFDTKARLGSGTVVTNARINFSKLRPEYSAELFLKNIELEPFLKGAFGSDHTEYGVLTAANAHIQGEGFASDDIKESIRGALHAEVISTVLPSKFQDIPPFNIIFLPYTVLEEALAMVGGVLLPDAFGEIGSGLSELLSESGQLTLDKTELSVAISKGEIKVEKAIVDPNLLPTVETSGKIGFDSQLEMVSKIKIAGFRLPLTVGGTVSDPVSDIPAFAIELVTEAGQGVINTALLPLDIVEALGEAVLDLADGENEKQMQEFTPKVLSVKRVSPTSESQE